MTKSNIRYTRYFAETIQRMREDGLLLVTAHNDGKPNVMTMGWGTIGSIWGRPIFLALVRPSRHSHSLIEEVSEFTVNVPPRELASALSHCGTVSGRDHDKFGEAKLTVTPSRMVKPPIVEECVIHYECRVVHKNDLVPESLTQAIRDDFYEQSDFHRVYFGEIVAAYADEDADIRLRHKPAAGPLPLAG